MDESSKPVRQYLMKPMIQPVFVMMAALGSQLLSDNLSPVPLCAAEQGIAVSSTSIVGWASKLQDPDKSVAGDAYVNLLSAGTGIFPYIYPELSRELQALEADHPRWFSDRTYPDQCFNSPPAELLIIELGRRALPEMKRLAQDSDPYIRKTVLYVLAREQDDGNVDTLLSFLSDPVTEIRHRAADLIGRLQTFPGSATNVLVHHVQRERDDRVRVYLAQALCRHENRVGLRALLQNLFNNDAEVRALSARALRLAAPSFRADCVKALEKALQNEKDKYAFAHIQGAYNRLKQEEDRLKAQAKAE